MLRYIFTVPLALLAAAAPLRAQHEHHPPAAPDSAGRDSTAAMAAMAATAPGHDMASTMEGPLGLSHERMGSGTSWMPDSSPMHATHKTWGEWTVMVHGVAFGQYDWQGSRRGDKQLGIVDWEMLMAMRRVGSGLLHLHGMASLEPLTLGARGYPLLLQTGESYRGSPLHDRQHPHDAFMELAALFQQPIARDLALELYGGLAGEPALGPVAFMHRPSAQSDPLAPLGHHWQDATHISYGVVTAGMYTRRLKLEGSLFNGREPDENRWNLDLRRLDAYSGRLTIAPTGRLSLSAWYGYLPSPEALHPEESVHRYGASALYGGRGLRGGAWASTLLWGANAHGGRVEPSALAETNLEIGRLNTLFGRAEFVRKSAEDLVLPGVDGAREFDIRSVVAGYVREVGSVPGGTIDIGGRVSVNFVPAVVGERYGTRTPKGLSVYVRVRPKRMASHAAMAMPMSAPMRDSSMRGMPPMPAMRGDSAAMRGDSAAMHGGAPTMAHDSSMKMMGDSGMRRDSTTGREPSDSAMHAMPGMKHAPAPTDTSAARAAAPAKPSNPAKPAAAGEKKAPAGKAAKTPARPSPKPKPATHHMPGMKMSGDTAHKPSP